MYTIVYLVQYTYTCTRAQPRILNGHPREEKRACRQKSADKSRRSRVEFKLNTRASTASQWVKTAENLQNYVYVQYLRCTYSLYDRVECTATVGWRAGAPRLLQAIAADGVIPFINVFSVTNLKGEPRRALYLTATIAETGVLLANVDYIAPIITMYVY